MSSAANYAYVMQVMAETARGCGRNPSDIQLVAVTKEHSWNQIQPVYQQGCRHFGESWIQEALPKAAGAPEDIHWHFIGSLQKNKVRKALQTFDLIHSVDSYELAVKISEISQEENMIAKILIEVNTSGEATKHGFALDGVRFHFDKIFGLQAVDVQGFMTMAPLVHDEYVVRSCFAKLWHLRDEIMIRSEGSVVLPHLSMGMSNDYQWAILEGATLVRVGSAIFGDRI